MLRLLIPLITILIISSCTTYDDPITTKQKSKKKAFQTKTLRGHDLIGHVKGCSTQVYSYAQKADPNFKRKEGSVTAMIMGSNGYPDTANATEYVEFSNRGRYTGTFTGNSGNLFASDAFLASCYSEEEEEEPSLKGAKKKFDNWGNCTEEKTKHITVTYLYDSVGNCTKRIKTYHKSSFRDVTTQTFAYDSVGNWIVRVSKYKYKKEVVPNPYFQEKIIRTLTYYPPEEVPKENKILKWTLACNPLILAFILWRS